MKIEVQIKDRLLSQITASSPELLGPNDRIDDVRIELYSSADGRCRFVVVMTPEELADFRDNIDKFLASQ